MNNSKKFWNNQDISKYFASKSADPRIEKFLNTYIQSPNCRALDLGCGGGRHTELLAKSKFNVSAIDVNPKMIEVTKNRISEKNLAADIRYGSILDIPYKDKSFDVIIATGVLHQAANVKEYKDAIKELSRIIKVGGYVLLNIFTNKIWDDTYIKTDKDDFAVHTKEGLPMTLLPKGYFIEIMSNHRLELYQDQGEDIKQENTGPRAVFRAFFIKK